MATKFIKGQAVKFQRNAIDKMDSTVVSGVVEKTGTSETEKQSYVIEFPNGWAPNPIRVKLYSLDVAKKYLFVTEDELTAIA